MRRRRLLAGVVVVVVVGALLAGLDLGARRFAEGRLAAIVAGRVRTDQPVTVTISGWPFLTQLAADRVDRVRVRAADLTVTGDTTTVRVAQLDATASSVGPLSDLSRAVIGDLDATVHLGWDQVSALIGVPIRATGQGRVQVRASVTLLGTEVLLDVSGVPYLVAGSRTVRLRDVVGQVAGVDVPPDVFDTAQQNLAELMQLPELPGVRYSSLDATPDAALIGLAGTDVAVSQVR